MPIYRSIAMLAPSMGRMIGDLFDALRERPDLPVNWYLVETYRDPERQASLFYKGKSKAGAWQSPHQYGLAADIVPFDGTKPIWPNLDDARWATLAVAAEAVGLATPIKWDPGHVQHPGWTDVWSVVR